MSQAAASFKDILSMPIEDIKPPLPVPMGTYDWRIKSHEFGKSTKKQTDFCAFTCVPIAFGPDVDTTLLEAYGGLNEIEMKLTFYITLEAASRLREFLEGPIGLNGPSLEALIPQATNMTFRGYVGQRPSDDGQKMFSEITKTMKIE